MFNVMVHFPRQSFSECNIKQEVSCIIKRLVLVCREIPAVIIDLTDDPFVHGHEQCRVLPLDARLWDKWVHGMFYELVSYFIRESHAVV